MTKIAGIAALFMLGVIILLAVSGFSGNAPALALGVLCAVPLFSMLLGFALGRSSNEFSIIRKDRQPRAQSRAKVLS